MLAIYRSVQCLLSFSLLSKNVKFQIHGAIIFPVILYGCENLSLIFRVVGHRLKVFGNRMMREDVWD
jgi:hypothetical protein